jgi:hypothetical protein
MGIRKGDARCGQTVQIRCRDRRFVTQRLHVAITQIVSQHENNVRLCRSSNLASEHEDQRQGDRQHGFHDLCLLGFTRRDFQANPDVSQVLFLLPAPISSLVPAR